MSDAAALTHIGMEVSPAPSDAEMAAILAAYNELWPRPIVATEDEARTPNWRFSGRWWSSFTSFT